MTPQRVRPRSGRAPRLRPTAGLASLALLLGGPPLAAQTYSARYEVPAGGFSMCAGETRTLSVRVTNTGTRAWGSDTHLGYHWELGPTTVVRDGVHALLPGPVGPGGSATVAATVTAPASVPLATPPASYTLSFDLVDNTTWFSAQGVPTGDVRGVAILTHSQCVVARSLPPIAITGPHIDSCNARTQPGNVVWCLGRGFGGAPGQVLLKGLGPTTEVPDLAPSSRAPRHWWADDSFLLDVPGGLSGFRRGNARIQVVSAGGLASNEVPILVEPVLDLQIGVPCLVATSCSHGHTYDMCDDPIFAGHQVDSFVVSPDSGTDVWSARLANDWVFLDGSPLNWGARSSGIDVGHLEFSLLGMTAGTQATMSVRWGWDWHLWTASALYSLSCNIQGPRGVPWN